MTDGNGNAFPETETEITHDCGVQFNRTFSHNGLTKREYFAAMAMQGMLSDLRQVDQIASGSIGLPQLATMAADALIEALNK